MTVVASIRDIRGATTILEWVRVNGGADTRAIAARFCMSTVDARKAMLKLERAGKVRSRRDTYGGYRSGGAVMMWEATP